MQIVNLRHPGYDDQNNILLTLQAPDDPDGGVHHQTARLACCVVAGNRWDGFLSITQDNPVPISPRELILKRKDYYFFLPEHTRAVQDAQGPKPTNDKKKLFSFGKKNQESRPQESTVPTSTQSKTVTKYPVTARFDDWEFPTANLPPLWNSVKDVYKSNPASGKKGIQVKDHDHSEVRFITNERCRLCGKREETEKMWIWPKHEKALFRSMGKRCLIYDELFDPRDEEEKEDDDDDGKRPERLKLHDDRNNLCIGPDCELEDEHRDIIDGYKEGQFLFVPKFEDQGSPKMTAHIFGTFNGGIQAIHNKPLLKPEAASIELLFVRFAWACFKQLEPFLRAGVDRMLRFENHEFDLITRNIRGAACRLLAGAGNDMRFCREPDSEPEKEPEAYKSSLHEAFEKERHRNLQQYSSVDQTTMVSKYDWRLRHDAKCSICKEIIYEIRWHCLQCETSFDCCQFCFDGRKLNSWKHALKNHDFVLVTAGAFMEVYKTDELVPEDEVDSEDEEVRRQMVGMSLKELQADGEEGQEITPLDRFINAKATYKRDLLYYSLPDPKEGMQWIRILTLWPGKPLEPIVAHLEIAELSTAGTFEALSYTWGDPEMLAAINVSGSSLLVTHNLKVALNYIRHPQRPRRLWIDAICINQEDLEERAKQVMIMRDIYRRAYRTIIWLGEEDEEEASRAYEVCQVMWKRNGIKFFDDNLKHLKTETSAYANLVKMNERLDKRLRTIAKIRLTQNGKAKTHTAVDDYIAENQIELSRTRDEWLDTYMRTGSVPTMQIDGSIDVDDDVSSVEDPPNDNAEDEEEEAEDEDKDDSDNSSVYSDISNASRAWSEDDMYERLTQLVNSLDEEEQKHQNAETEPAKPDVQEVKILRKLLERPWFSRVWIIQEAGMARSAVFQCGKTTMDWFVLGFGYGLVIDLHQGLVFMMDYDRPVFHMSETRDILAKARKYGDSLKELQLPFLLRRYRCSQATDPQDKVYALLGISQTDLTKYEFVPDYIREVEDTYKQVTKHLLNEYKNLDLLSVHRVPTVKTTKLLPTWVPDWSDTTRQPWPLLNSLSSDVEMLTLDTIRQRVFTATKNSELAVPVSIDEEKQRLTLRGYKISTISELAEPIFFEEPNLDFLTQLSEALTLDDVSKMADAVSEMEEGLKFVKTLQQWEKIAGINSLDSTTRRANPDKLEAYARILMTEMDISIQETTPVAEYLLLTQTSTAILKAIRASPINHIKDKSLQSENPRALLGSAKQALEALEDTISDLLPKNGKAFAKAVSYMSYTYSRRLFRSHNGKLGMAPTFTMQSDHILLLEGGSVPFVLRPVVQQDLTAGNGYEVIGECYLIGAMYGEMWDASKCKDVVLV